MKNQDGQVVVEAVLLMVVLLGLSVAVQNYLQKQQFAQKMVQRPWAKLAGMIECGVWEPCSGKVGLHPSTRDRSLSFSPENE